MPYRVYHPFLWLYQWFLGAYFTIAFILLRFEKINHVHKNLYYSGHIVLILGCILVTVLPKVRREGKAATPSSVTVNKEEEIGGDKKKEN